MPFPISKADEASSKGGPASAPPSPKGPPSTGEKGKLDPSQGDEQVSPVVSTVLVLSALIELMVEKGWLTEDELSQKLAMTAMEPDSDEGGPMKSPGQGAPSNDTADQGANSLQSGGTSGGGGL